MFIEPIPEVFEDGTTAIRGFVVDLVQITRIFDASFVRAFELFEELCACLLVHEEIMPCLLEEEGVVEALGLFVGLADGFFGFCGPPYGGDSCEQGVAAGLFDDVQIVGEFLGFDGDFLGQRGPQVGERAQGDTVGDGACLEHAEQGGGGDDAGELGALWILDPVAQSDQAAEVMAEQEEGAVGGGLFEGMVQGIEVLDVLVKGFDMTAWATALAMATIVEAFDAVAAAIERLDEIAVAADMVAKTVHQKDNAFVGFSPATAKEARAVMRLEEGVFLGWHPGLFLSGT